MVEHRNVTKLRLVLAGTMGALILFALAGVQAARADEETDRRATALFDTVMSPYCPGVTLSACASTEATDLRNQVREWLGAGVDEATIQSRLVETYGATILGVPQGGTAGRVGWLVPIIAALLGLAVTALALRSLVSRSATKSNAAKPLPTVSIELEQAVAQELAKRRQQS